MAFNSRILSYATAAAALFGAGVAHAASDPKGVWLNDTGRGAVEIKDCDGGLCGYVVWVKAGTDSDGCGKMIIDRVKSAGEGVWDNGRIYSPDRKKWYDVDVKSMDGGKLKVTGHAMFLSKTMIWNRAPADLERCDQEKTAAVVPAQPAKSATAAINVPSSATAKAAPAGEAEPAVAPKAARAVQKPAKAEVAEAPPADDDDDIMDLSEGFDLEKGIHIGDKFSLQKVASGKCRVKAPFVNLTIKCPEFDK